MLIDALTGLGKHIDIFLKILTGSKCALNGVGQYFSNTCSTSWYYNDRPAGPECLGPLNV